MGYAEAVSVRRSALLLAAGRDAALMAGGRADRDIVIGALAEDRLLLACDRELAR